MKYSAERPLDYLDIIRCLRDPDWDDVEGDNGTLLYDAADAVEKLIFRAETAEEKLKDAENTLKSLYRTSGKYANDVISSFWDRWKKERLSVFDEKIERAIHDCEFRLKIIQVRIDRGYGNKETEQMKENVLLEIEALRALEKSMRIKGILGNDYDLDRLRELMEADREGRCVVLPSGKYTKEDGEKALKNAMFVCNLRNNAVNRYTVDAIAEKLTREAAEKALEMEGNGNE